MKTKKKSHHDNIDSQSTFLIFSIVEFSSYDSMKNALKELDGVDLKGSRVAVREVGKQIFF